MVYILVILLVTLFNLSYISVTTWWRNDRVIQDIAWKSLDAAKQKQFTLDKEKPDVKLVKMDKIVGDKKITLKNSFNYRIIILNGGYMAKITFKGDGKKTLSVYVNPFTKKVVASE